MNIKKYFWSLKDSAVRETENILKNPAHPRFIQKFYIMLSMGADSGEVFSLISKEDFVDIWPKMRQYWLKHNEAKDSFYWWETVYTRLLEKIKGINKKPFNEPEIFMRNIGHIIKRARTDKGWNQFDLSARSGIEQPEISAIEKGKKNITLEKLYKICAVLGIKDIPIDNKR